MTEAEVAARGLAKLADWGYYAQAICRACGRTHAEDSPVLSQDAKCLRCLAGVQALTVHWWFYLDTLSQE